MRKRFGDVESWPHILGCLRRHSGVQRMCSGYHVKHSPGQSVVRPEATQPAKDSRKVSSTQTYCGTSRDRFSELQPPGISSAGERASVAPAEATECVTINAVAVIRLTAQYRGSPPPIFVVVARGDRQHRRQIFRRCCALRSNRHESLSEAAKMTEVITTDAISRLRFKISVAPTECTSDSQEQLNSVVSARSAQRPRPRWPEGFTHSSSRVGVELRRTVGALIFE